MPIVELAAPAVAAVAAGVVWRVVLPRLAEPDTDGESKRSWVDLVTVPTTTAVVAAAAAAGVAASVAPGWAQPLWLVAAVFGVCLVMMDGLTTWISATLTWATHGAAALAVLAGVLWGTGEWTDALWVLCGALAAGLTFLLPWLVRGSFGFGDVRFAPLVGALGASLGLLGWGVAISAGCLLAAGWTLLRRHRDLGQDQVHPWAPPLLAGAYVALGASTLFG